MKRRKFVKNAALGSLCLSSFSLTGCQGKPTSTNDNQITNLKDPFFKISLAQWSLNKAFNEQGMDPLDFPFEAKQLGFEAVEYVTQLYKEIYTAADNKYLVMKNIAAELDKRSRDHGVKNHLIMVDQEGLLAADNREKRKESIDNHKRWVDIAAYLGCSAIRVNVDGEIKGSESAEAATDALMRLGSYAQDFNVNVIVENHGGRSSDPNWLINVIKNTNMNNCGILPDFGNWCVREESRDGKVVCVEETTDKYKAVEMMMPYAKAVSAKANSVDKDGNEPNIDYYKMIKIVKDSGYNGYIGVEYEGPNEKEGIVAIKNLLIKAAQLYCIDCNCNDIRNQGRYSFTARNRIRSV
jgi:sugar phosphate isomerase/epimerase